MNKVIFDFKYLIITLFLFVLAGCSKNSTTSKGAVLFDTQCARCHIAPDINHLPKELWANAVLPEMGARMGIKDVDFKPYKGMGFEEMEIVHNSAIYPFIPALNEADWKILKEYIINNAPDSLPKIKVEVNAKPQTIFTSHPISLDTVPGTFITFLQYQSDGNKIWAGDIGGNLIEYNFNSSLAKAIGKTENAIVDYCEKDTVTLVEVLMKLKELK